MAESMKGLKRTHRCAELSAANVGEKVTIMGWVQKKPLSIDRCTATYV